MSLKLEPSREHLQLSLASVPACDPEVGVLATDLDVSPGELAGQAGA